MKTCTSLHHALRRPCGAVLAIAVAVTAACELRAAEATSEMRVALLQEVAAAAAGGAQSTYLSVPLAGPILTGGAVEAVNDTVVTDSAAVWSAGQFDPGDESYLFELTSGAAAGWWSKILETRTGPPALRLAEALPAGVAVGDGYRVRRFLRLDALLGDGASLAAGADPSSADQLLLIDPVAGDWRTVFRSDYAGFEGWWSADFQPAAGQLFAPNQGLIVRRIATSSTVLAFSGVMRTTAVRVHIASGYNVTGTGYLHTGLTLAASGLYTGSVATGLKGGTSATAADNVIVPRAGGGFTTYYYSTTTGSTGWYDTTNQAAGSVVLPPVAGFIIWRKDTTAFDWVVPLEGTP